MRPQLVLRAAPALAPAVALGTAFTPAAPAPAVAAADPQGAAVQAHVRDRTLGYGERVVLTGRLASGRAGVPVALQYRPAGAAGWRTLGRVPTGAGGGFRLAASLRRSGAVRVAGGGPSGLVARSAQPPVGAGQRVSVRAAIAARSVRHHVRVGRRWHVAGRLRSPGAGRLVRLQLRRDGRWRTVDRDRTSAAGRFSLHRRLRRPTSAPARIRFAGDGANAASTRRLGRVNAYRRAPASWYGPGLYGNRLSCGGRLTPGTLGVAHRTLPCGARLTLRYRGHVVRTRVVDRGPYAGGREFDLTAATRRRLHFGSTGMIGVTR